MWEESNEYKGGSGGEEEVNTFQIAGKKCKGISRKIFLKKGCKLVSSQEITLLG